MKLAQEFWPR